MLTTHDDYPIHQTPYPVAHPSSGDLNHYDRYFFNGYTADGSLFFAAALGLYANRKVMDAAFSVVRDGVEYSLIASRRSPLDPAETRVGPITISVEEPMRRLRVSVVPNEHGLEADLVFEARTVAVEEPHFTHQEGIAPSMDLTRLTQWGAWSGSLKVNGETVQLEPGKVRGCRDRSWGIRPVGERNRGGAPSQGPNQFFWLWAPINFDDVCIHFDVNEDAAGLQWHSNGVVIPVLKPGDPVLDSGNATQKMAAVGHQVFWEKGTRRSESSTIHLVPFEDDAIQLDLQPLLTFQMLGIGYGHPQWAHGVWKGEEAVHGERWKLSEIDPLQPHFVHIQQLCRVTMGDKVGTGVLEQAIYGPHEPSGFRGFLDGAS